MVGRRMRKSEMLLALALFGSVATSLWFWTELRAERALNAELGTRLDSLPAPTSPTDSPAPAAATAPVEATEPRAANYSAATSTARDGREASKQDDVESYQRRMLKDPRYREAWRAQQRINYSLRRENLVRLLSLTPEQADGVIEIGIDRQLAWMEQTPAEPVPDNFAEQQRALHERYEREDQQRLRELLGEEKRAQFQQYMESRYTRAMVDQFRTSLAGVDLLREDQVEPLISALHAESARMKEELLEYRASIDGEDPNAAQRYAERSLEMLKASHERMHTAAAPILSGSQLKRLDVWLKQELDRQEADSKMQRIWSKAAAADASASGPD